MKTIILLLGSVLLLAGCSTTKIASTPHVGYRMNEQLVVLPIAGVNELDNDYLLQWTNARLEKELRYLQPVSYQDVFYQSKQFGITLPEFNRYDTSLFDTMSNKIKLNYVLAGEVVCVKTQDNDSGNSSYEQIVAVLSFQLIDLRHRTVSWYCTVRFTANPVEFKDSRRNFNLHSENGAVYKAYRKAINRLIRNCELIPNRTQ